MTTNEIRTKFLKFFESKKHKIVASDSLVPKNDPTVLFTTAGMQQFKRQFLGEIDSFTRAATSQKCLRTDDLDEVGKTDFHHTFFEMLGNFSFGNYFKKEAIEWAWEFLTKILGIPPEKLWVSAYKDDAEAENIWLENIKIPKEKLVKLDDKSNFWPANAKEKGPNGPCGPCSEIFFDWGKNPKCTSAHCDPSCDCGRFCEVWNLVFTQFNRKDGGILEPLPNKNIDTGMGLERLAAVMQGKKNNFETDIFAPILKAIEELKLNIELSKKRIIADHIRAIVFGISDGVIPSNEGRGYVMKKLIINCSDIAFQAGVEKPVIYKLPAAVSEAMKGPYPEVEKQIANISSMIKSVEESYIKVCKARIPELEKEIKAAASSNAVGEVMFKFKDTYGLTLTTIDKAILKLYEKEGKTSIFIDEARKKFNKLMEDQQEKSRAGSKLSADVFTNADIDLNVPKTDFMGYDHLKSTSTIIKLLVNNKGVNEVKTGDQVKVILDKTPFYAESGGQVGDKGIIYKDKAKIIIEDTQKISDIFLHIGTVKEGKFNVNDQIKAEIETERRIAIMRNHTATHILQAALREVLGLHVKQQGSYVDEERFRFDFTHHKALSDEEILKIENLANEYIIDCDTVTKEYLSYKDAQNTGALAFFAEKYGETVRVISINNYSKEFCGGTHLDSTGQIGCLKIISESAIAQGIRRIEAVTGKNAFNYINEQQSKLKNVAQILKSSVDEAVDRAQAITNKLKAQEKELESLRFEHIKNSIDEIITKAESVKDSKVISHLFENIEIEILRKVADLIKQKAKSAVAVLGSKSTESAAILISVSDDLVALGIKANDLIKEITPIIGGQGGGRPQLAQAGTKDAGKIAEAIKKASNIIKESIKK